MSGELGPKLAEGDGQTPEGFYEVNPRGLNPKSHYHLAFNIGYPNAYDRAHGRTGSFIMVHGSRVSIGCFAMTNDSIEQIYCLVEAALERGQAAVPIHCFPFRMTAERMALALESPWFGFWTQLHEGYIAFEATRFPPVMAVRRKRYLREP
jgi:murein L,D-transpeptidase YafK